MRYKFYDSSEYRKKQSQKTILAWKAGQHDHNLTEVEDRKCKKSDCINTFHVKVYDPKQSCSHICSASYNNKIRGSVSLETRLKISESIKKSPYHYTAKGKILVPRLVRNCLYCKKEFATPKWQNHKYCSVNCSIADIGSRPTSPKAARAKAGIRPDIDAKLYFFSRWEANFARILNLLKVKWEFQPLTFDLKTQRYTPDFYLSDYDSYIEIKNFLSDYSFNRDKKFRLLYPNINLVLILKMEYLGLQEDFSLFIKNWEFS